MAPGKDIEIIGIAAAHHAGQCDTALQATIYDVIIARAQPGITQRQLTQLVFLVRIDPGVIKHDVGLVLVEKRPDMALYHRKIDLLY